MNSKNPLTTFFTRQNYPKNGITQKKNIFVKGIVFLIKCYQKYISPLSGPSCRFYPTCSAYALQAFEQYGVFKGGYLATRRILKCHPFNKGGYDPLPSPKGPNKEVEIE